MWAKVEAAGGTGLQLSGPWSAGDAYEPYVGRWSRAVARELLAWLAQPPGGRWLDVGCGTGALTSTVLAHADPGLVLGADPSAAFLEHAAAHVLDPRAAFVQAGAEALPVEDGSYDVVVSGLVLNFVPDPLRGLMEMRRAVRPGGTVALYVWDYAEGMQMMRSFWDVAAELDPEGEALDEASRFPLCRPEPLRRLAVTAGLGNVEVRPVVVPTTFIGFDDYWQPFLGGQGPAPTYVASLSQERRTALRDALRTRLPVAADGALRMTARAWAVRGRR